MYGLLKNYYAGFNKIESAYYVAYYCRVCYCLRNLYGPVGGAFVDYDLVLYSILLQLAVNQDTPQSYKCHYFRGKERLNFLDDDLGNNLAVFTLAVFKSKFDDDVKDENSFNAKFLLNLFKKKFHKAQTSHEALFTLVCTTLSKISDYETLNISFEEILEIYGEMVAKMFSVVSENIPEDYLLVMKAVAKWEYFMDMLLDYDDDYKKGAFNPIIDKRYKTLQEYISDSVHYLYISDFYNKLFAELNGSVDKIKSDRIEWKIVKKIVTIATGTTFYKILRGEFKTNAYFKDKICKRFHRKTRL